MEITVQLFSILRDYLPPGSKGGRVTLSWPDNSDITLEQVISKLGIERRFEIMAREFIKKSDWQVLVNGISVNEIDVRLNQGDLVQIFPPMSGG